MRQHRPPNHEKLALKWTDDYRKNRGKKVCLPVLRLSPYLWNSISNDSSKRKILFFRLLDRFCDFHFQFKQMLLLIKPKSYMRMVTLPPKTQCGCAGTARQLLLMQFVLQQQSCFKRKASFSASLFSNGMR